MSDPFPSRHANNPKHERPRFLDLLSTSHAIKRALSPVDVRPSFVTKLREELNSNVESARATLSNRQKRRATMKRTAIGAGLAVYSITLSLVLIRLVRWIFGRFRNSTPSTEG